MRHRHQVAGLLLVGLVALVAACASPPSDPVQAGSARVVAVIDGDTVVLDIDGAREHVRLLGIDTPETNHPTRPVECFGAEASSRLGELIPLGSVVRLERDVEARDHYGRLLLYLFRATDDLFVNHELVLGGYATTLHVDPNGAHRAVLADAQQAARSAGRGLWGACGGPGVPIDPLVTG